MKQAIFGNWKNNEETYYLGEIKVFFKDVDITKNVEAPITIIDDDGTLEKLMPKLEWKEMN